MGLHIDDIGPKLVSTCPSYVSSSKLSNLGLISKTNASWDQAMADLYKVMGAPGCWSKYMQSMCMLMQSGDTQWKQIRN